MCAVSHTRRSISPAFCRIAVAAFSDLKNRDILRQPPSARQHPRSSRMLSDKDAGKSKRVMTAMLEMNKLDMKRLEQAYHGE
jgi:hypothetical protein